MGQTVEVSSDTLQRGESVEIEFDNGDDIINIEGQLIVLQPNGVICVSTAVPLWSNFNIVFPSGAFEEISGFSESATNLQGVYDVTLSAFVDVNFEIFEVQQIVVSFFVLPESYLGPITLIGSSLAVFGGYIWFKKSNTRI